MVKDPRLETTEPSSWIATARFTHLAIAAIHVQLLEQEGEVVEGSAQLPKWEFRIRVTAA
jgi:hypothetical protein